MIPSTRRLCLLLVLGAPAATFASAQNASLSPNLSPLLTDDPATQPITTLAIDLLATPRPYIFDPTGASVLANALNPSLYASSLSTPNLQADVQLRDSSQTGQISPYSAAAARLGLSFSSPAASGGSASATGSSAQFPASRDPYAAAGDRMQGDEQSSWGTGGGQTRWGGGSSFGGQSTASSWGMKPLRGESMGRRQPESFDQDPSANSDSTSAAFSSANFNSDRSRRSSPYSARNGADSTATRNRSSLDVETADRVSPPTGRSRMSASASPSYLSNPSAGESKQQPADGLNFSRQAPVPQYTLETSPFSLSAANGELTFLNPNIFAATTGRRSLSSGEAGTATREGLRQTFGPPPTSATHYGLANHPGLTGWPTGASDRAKRRAHPTTSLLDSGNP